MRANWQEASSPLIAKKKKKSIASGMKWIYLHFTFFSYKPQEKNVKNSWNGRKVTKMKSNVVGEVIKANGDLLDGDEAVGKKEDD